MNHDTEKQEGENKMNKFYYAMKGIEKKHDVNVLGHIQSLPLMWADGMIGVIPVFDDEGKAKAYSGDLNIIELVVDKEFLGC